MNVLHELHALTCSWTAGDLKQRDETYFKASWPKNIKNLWRNKYRRSMSCNEEVTWDWFTVHLKNGRLNCFWLIWAQMWITVSKLIIANHKLLCFTLQFFWWLDDNVLLNPASFAGQHPESRAGGRCCPLPNKVGRAYFILTPAY